jgi:hypothetical protein
MDWLAARQCLLSLAPSHHPTKHWLAAEQMDWLMGSGSCSLAHSLPLRHLCTDNWLAAEPPMDWQAASQCCTLPIIFMSSIGMQPETSSRAGQWLL